MKKDLIREVVRSSPEFLVSNAQTSMDDLVHYSRDFITGDVPPSEDFNFDKIEVLTGRLQNEIVDLLGEKSIKEHETSSMELANILTRLDGLKTSLAKFHEKFEERSENERLEARQEIKNSILELRSAWDSRVLIPLHRIS